MSKKEQPIEVLPTGWAHRYEVAYNQIYDAALPYVKTIVIEEPLGRHAKLLAEQSIILAERGEISKREHSQGDMTFDPDYMLTPTGVK